MPGELYVKGQALQNPSVRHWNSFHRNAAWRSRAAASYHNFAPPVFSGSQDFRFGIQWLSCSFLMTPYKSLRSGRESNVPHLKARYWFDRDHQLKASLFAQADDLSTDNRQTVQRKDLRCKYALLLPVWR